MLQQKVVSNKQKSQSKNLFPDLLGKLLKKIRNRLSHRFDTWVDRRIPSATKITLNHRRLFIFVSNHGIGFFIVVALIFIAAANYQNNLIFAFALFLLSIFNTAIILTFQNISGLSVKQGQTLPVFAGQLAEVNLFFEAAKQAHKSLVTGFTSDYLIELSLQGQQTKCPKLLLQATTRGYQQLPRLYLKSQYPLGILRCWTWLSFSNPILVYPAPLSLDGIAIEHQVEGQGKLLAKTGFDELSGFRSYQSGDTLRDIHWPSLAKAQPLMSKQNLQAMDENKWVDWYALDVYPLSLEQRLSVLCGWVLAYASEGVNYGLRLPKESFEPDQGEQHKHKLLTALAVY